MLILVLVWLLLLTVLVVYLLSILLKLFKTKDRGLKQAIYDTLESNRKVSAEIGVVNNSLNDLNKALKNAYQRAAIVRFNPFERMGGEQSYCLAIINEEYSGVILTFLYTKEGVRAYMKEVIKGVAKGADLSKEEREAMEKARSQGVIN